MSQSQQRECNAYRNATSLDGVSNPNGPTGVLRKDMCCQTVDSVIRELDGLFFGFELDDYTNRAKDLFLYDLHLMTNVSENGRVDEVTLVPQSFTAYHEAGALLFS
jgi:hypothetical protein